MTTNYAAGQRIAVQGIPSARLSNIAQDYVHQNMASIHATEADYRRFIEITREAEPGNNRQRMARVQEMRAEALEGKTGEDAARISRSYDLAIAFFGIHTDLVAASLASNAEPFRLPSLSGRLAQATTYSSPYGGGGTPAGAWRERAETGARANREAQTNQRRATMTPLEAALDELPAADAAVKGMVERASREAQANGVSDPIAMTNNMRAAFEAQDEWYWTITKSGADKAKDVLKRAQAIATERGADNIFVIPAEEVQQTEPPAQDSPSEEHVSAPASTHAAAGASAGNGGGHGAAHGGGGRNGGTTASGLRVYGRRDGTPAPNPAEVPNLRDEAQVRALQERLGVTVDGMYGPQTHAAMLAAAQRQNKQPQEFDFTAEGIFEAFIAALTGAPAGEGQAVGAGSPDQAGGAATQPDLRTQLAAQLTAVANISDAVVDYRQQGLLTVSDATVLSAFLDKFKDDQGVSSLTAEQIATISVHDGVISSPLIGQVEQALGLRADNNMDARLEAALNNATVKSAVVAAFTGTAVRGATDVATAGGTAVGREAPASLRR